jgi:hypothetical protein
MNGSKPWQVAPGATTCGANFSSPDWLLYTLASRLPSPACVSSNSSGAVVTQCPNSNSGAGTSASSSGTGATPQGATPTSSYPVSLIMINEFGIYRDGSTGATPTFIELYNASNKSYELKGHTISFREPGQTADVASAAFSKSTPLPAHGYYLMNVGAASALKVGGLFTLRNPAGAILDAVGFGSGANTFFACSGAPAIGSAIGAIARHPNGANTNNNQADFRFTTAPTPGAANQ